MGYSREEYTYAGGPQEWPINFSLGFLSRSDVRFYVVGELDGLGDQITRPITWLSDGLIRIDDPIPNPSDVVIERTVSKTELDISLNNTGPVTRDTLSRGFTQLMMNIHELLDGRLDSFTGALLDNVEGIRVQALAYRDEVITLRDETITLRDSTALDRLAAQTAKLASEAAQAAAEAAQADAGANQIAAEAAQTAAQVAQALAEAAKTAAETASTASQTAQAAAAVSETNSATSAASASQSLSSAIAAKVAAEIARDAAQASATEAAQSAAIAEASAIGVPTGTILHIASLNVPTGFLKANGAAVSRATYATLFAEIGTTYGAGDGSTTFNLPDLRGEFLRGLDDGRGVDTGRTIGSTQTDAFKSHLHGVDPPATDTVAGGGHQHETLHTQAYSPYGYGSGNSGKYINTSDSGLLTHARTSYVSGHVHTLNIPAFNSDATGGSETRPRNVALLAIIKY